MLKSLGLFAVFDRDLIPYVSYMLIIQIIGTVELLCVSIYVINYLHCKRITSVDVFVRRYRAFLKWILFAIGLFLYFKINDVVDYVLLTIQLASVFFLVDVVSNVVFAYHDFGEEEKRSNFTDKPVNCISDLTIAQRNTLNELIYIIDERTNKDALNIALLGEWGSGKTTITNTLTREIQKRTVGNKYFILKISTHVTHEVKSVVTYVKKFFECLFEKYEVSVLASVDTSFLFSLSKMLSDASSMPLLPEDASSECFLDYEQEKRLFSTMVQKLLQKSKRKNIILIIDDVDRNIQETEIVKVLTEFSAIEGIISIVSMDVKYDKLSIDDNSDANHYNPLDKYIHYRVRIPFDNQIENDEIVSCQMLLDYDLLTVYEDAYISCFNNIDCSLFSRIDGAYNTSYNRLKGGEIQKYNILTDLFFTNLKKEKKTFGIYLSELVNEFILTKQEILPYVMRMLNSPAESWDNELWTINVQWTEHREIKEFDWIARNSSNAQQMYFSICELKSAIEYISQNSKDLCKAVHTVDDLHDVYIKRKFNDIQVVEGTFIDSGYEMIKSIAFDKQEQQMVNKLLIEGEYAELEEKISKKAELVGNYYGFTCVMNDFMSYIRRVLNNFRSYKMQLREANVRRINYLDYVIDEWQKQTTVYQRFAEMQNKQKSLKNVNIQLPSINDCINTMLFYFYIVKIGRGRSGELHNCRIFLLNDNEKYIAISLGRENEDIKYILDSKGNDVICNEAIKRQIYEKNRHIWE